MIEKMSKYLKFLYDAIALYVMGMITYVTVLATAYTPELVPIMFFVIFIFIVGLVKISKEDYLD